MTWCQALCFVGIIVCHLGLFQLRYADVVVCNLVWYRALGHAAVPGQSNSCRATSTQSCARKCKSEGMKKAAASGLFFWSYFAKGVNTWAGAEHVSQGLSEWQRKNGRQLSCLSLEWFCGGQIRVRSQWFFHLWVSLNTCWEVFFLVWRPWNVCPHA